MRRKRNRRLRPRTVHTPLRLTSMMDILTTLLLFLLKSFVVEGEAITPVPGVNLPESSSNTPAQASVVVAIFNNTIMLDGQVVAQVSRETVSGDLLIEALADRLDEARERSEEIARMRGSDAEFHGRVAIQGDREIEFDILQRVMYTCGYSGYEELSLAVLGDVVIMGHAHAGIPPQYQQPLWGEIDPVLKRCFIAAGILGVIVLIGIFIAPALPPKPNALEDMPDRLARLILEKPKAPAGDLAERIAKLEAPRSEPRAEEKVEPAKPKVEPRRRTSPPRVETDKGAQGRQKAKVEVAQNLAQVTGSVDKVLESVSKSLPASTNAADKEPAQRRRRSVRSGRSGTQIATVGGSSNLGSADMGGSAIESKGISIAAITDLAVDGGGGSGEEFSSPGGGGSADAGSRNDYRSNESLLAVVRRYAPGIQFCYDNELKRNPGLRGKLVVNITVLADGSVSEAIVVEDKLGSPAVTQCVVAQIRGWRFPAIPSGTTSFKTPFVFTPPN